MTVSSKSAHSGDPVPGQFTLVLHSHLPWLANHGRWPVGEEWLYQSWAASYLPVFAMLRRLAADGARDQVSFGITPVLAAQLDDPHCAASMYEWLADWQLRAVEAAVAPDADRRTLGNREYRVAGEALAEFEAHWRHGGSPLIRTLASSGVLEILGGPLAHPFAPLLDPRLRRFSLGEGLADARSRWALDPAGIWAPECAFAPGMEIEYADAGVGHFMVDGPTLKGDTALGRTVGDTDVVAFGRDLAVSYRVWSPKSGYPGHSAYRDFHTYDHLTGLKPARVTGRNVASGDKKPYDPARADAVIDRHVDDFVGQVRNRLIDESARLGRPALVVAAFDTELFGHWWHEGPVWLERVLRRLPEAGVRVGTLATARRDGFVGAPVDLPPSSWGSGKDWRVWNGPQVEHLVRLNAEVSETALGAIDKLIAPGGGRHRIADQILRETLMTVASDWPFMVSKDTAAHYAVERAHKHAHATREICDAALRGRTDQADTLAANWARADNLFAGLDARRLSAITVHGRRGGR
ncbi:1,4-alpha-glucan branching protein domain-containing protein [Gordonia insulae]|uniref:Putative 1,4-alpha-glucan branching enzyme n=1 Tax=Gordonia insulae TaxID=2420509 RepID=A0A3G8JVI7_9ACTN|nr:glycoside hydrolase family 57 protein [Gordonia insulae]AZG48805.1 putative 1,4-alpha-glucan branching enzyme [Gordonia insulae]